MPEEYKAPETDEGLKLTAREAEQLSFALEDFTDPDAVLNPEFLPGGGWSG